MGRIQAWEWPGQHNGAFTLRKKKPTQNLTINLSLILLRLISTSLLLWVQRARVSPVHTLAPDPFHRTIFLNSESYDEASMLDSMADSAKLWNLLPTTSCTWVHLFVQGARQNHASQSQNQTMPSILLKSKPAQKAVSCDVGALIQELLCSLWLLPPNPKHTKVHKIHGILP